VTFTIDSSALIDAVRLPDAAARLRAFVAEGHRIVLSSVIVAELEAGARTPRARAALESGVLGHLLRRGRIEAPDADVWQRSGRFLGDHAEWKQTPGQQNDVLLAMQSRQRGWTLISRDRDFGRLSQHILGLRVLPPFPSVPRR
jgi:predicted nucleic acid-binding protein